MIRSSMFVMCGLAMTACAANSDDDGALSGDESAIVGGTPTSSDRSVVELVIETGDGGYSCTATFISKRVLLTAAHCVTKEDNPHVLESGTFKALLRPREQGATSHDWITFPRSGVHFNPAYDGELEGDVAVLVLDHDVNVTPIPIHRQALTSDMNGTAIRIVGYGITAPGHDDDEPRARTVTTKFRGMAHGLLLIGNTGQQACEGDSGGPAFLKVNGHEEIVGTDALSSSDRENQDCKQGDLYMPVVKSLDFIDRYL